LTHRTAYDPQQWIAEHLEGIFQAIPREGAGRTVRAIERHGIGFGALAARSWAEVLIAAAAVRRRRTSPRAPVRRAPLR
jgi:hypothetical protein